MADSISFDEVKQIIRDAIDDSANINELLQNVANRIYQKGKNETYQQQEARELPMTNCACWNCTHCHDGGALSGWFCDIHGSLSKTNRFVYKCGAYVYKTNYEVDSSSVT